MAKCHLSADSASLPRPPMHPGLLKVSKEIELLVTCVPAALTRRTEPVFYALIENPSSLVSRTVSLRRRAGHTAGSGKVALPIHTSIA